MTLNILIPIIVAAASVLLVTTPVFFALVALALACTSIYVSRRIYGNIFSPISLFSAGWLIPSACIVFLPHHIKFDGLEIHIELWVAVFLSYLAFLAGYFYYLLFINNGRFLTTRQIKLHNKWEAYPGEQKWCIKLIRFFFILGMAGFAINISHVVRAGGLGIYLELGFRDVETIFGQSTIINYLYFMNPLVLILGTIHLCRFGYKRSTAVMMAMSFVSLFFHGIKSTIIFPTIVAIIALFYCRRSLRPINVVISLLFVLFGFQFVTVGRNIPFLLDREMGWFEILTYRIDDIFLYFTPAYANLQEEILNLKGYRGGVESFQFLGEIVSFILGRREGVTQTIFDGESFYLFDEAYNTGTFLREHYRDFGYIGIVVFSFTYGVMSNFFYCRYMKEPSVRNVAIYAIISLMLLISFFSNHYFKIQYWFWIIAIFVGDGVMRMRKKQFMYMGMSGEAR